MNDRSLLRWLCCTLAVLVSAGAALGGNTLILNVPDWDQPNDYAPTGGLVVGDAPQWCSPVAGANLIGYWEDQKNCPGLADGLAWSAIPNSPVFPNPANAGWNQGCWHDCTIEMGFYMDTGTWATAGKNGNGVWPAGQGVTALNNIGPGVIALAIAAGYAPPAPTKDVWAPAWVQANYQAMWNNYTAEIDAGRPVLCSFDIWITPPIVGSPTVNGQTVDKYNFNVGTAPHTVTGVGYLDANTAALGDEWFIAQDNWPSTGQYVAVPLNWNANTQWRQNDYITIPEPVTLLLLGVGGTLLIRRRRL